MKKVDTKPVTVRLSVPIIARLEKLSETKGLKKSAIITIALEKYAREENNRDVK